MVAYLSHIATLRLLMSSVLFLRTYKVYRTRPTGISEYTFNSKLFLFSIENSSSQFSSLPITTFTNIKHTSWKNKKKKFITVMDDNLMNHNTMINSISSQVKYRQCRIYHCAQVCLRTGPRWPGGQSSCHNIFYDGFLLMWCNFKFEGVLFRSDSRHNDVDCNDCPVCSLFIKFDYFIM